MKKLVPLDSAGWLTEIDLVSMRREAQQLIDYIEAASPQEEQTYRYRARILPLAMRALAAQVNLPYKGSEPYDSRVIHEGWEPTLVPGFAALYERFMNRIYGDSSLQPASRALEEPRPAVVSMVDGRRCAGVEFDE